MVIHTRGKWAPIHRQQGVCPGVWGERGYGADVDDSITGEYSVGEFRRNLAEILGRVQYGDERIAVTRRGRIAGVLISITNARILEDLEETFDIDGETATAYEQVVGIRGMILDAKEWQRERMREEFHEKYGGV